MSANLLTMNAMKKIYILVMLVLTSTITMAQTSVWNGGRTVWTQGSGTESDPYLIESADNLALLAYMVNKGYNTEGMHFRLTTDIDLNGSEELQWVPIGLGDRCYNDDGCNVGSAGNIRSYFQGHFDGNNHYISNIYIDNSDKKYGASAGLFGYAKGKNNNNEVSPAIIENIFLTNGYIKGSFCGGIVGDGGSPASTVVSRCWNGATIEGVANSRCGGIVGNNVYQVNNCYNKGTVTGYYAGGIVGYGTALTIEECYNEGDISGTYIGGIYGLSMRHDVYINNCYNTGHIDANGENLMPTIPAGPAAGGIAGIFAGNSCTVISCYNVGAVTSTQDAGCILAFGPNATFLSNAYINTCTAGGEGTPLSEEYMRSQTFVDDLNGRDQVWALDENNINDGFPILVENNLAVKTSPEPSFKLYPNPTHGRFIVEGTGLVTIVDMLGQQVYRQKIDGILSIELPKGLYFVTLDNATRKLVID